ncbi:hypothetical protein LCGC14_1590070, partial [marine sediment metagenome]
MKSKNLFVSLIGLIFLSVFFSNIVNSNISNELYSVNVPEISQGVITPDNLIPINFTINIDG